MALYLFTLSSVPILIFLLVSLCGVFANSEWSGPSLLYAVEDDQSHGLRPELRLLEADSDGHAHRQRRYVPDSRPLDEYTSRRNKMLTDNGLSGRQTKDIRFTDVKQPQTEISENSAARAGVATTPVPAPTLTVTSPTAPQPTPVNKSVIISADFYNGTSPPTSPKPVDDDDLAINTNSDDMITRTMSQNNITTKEEDYHVYYNSTFLVNYNVGQAYWVDMSKRDDVMVNHMLSKSHRRAVTVKLSFDFPFYGHLVRNVTIATGGFLYTGEYVHSWLAATQYIAPLMANFDTSLSNNSFVKYVDNGTAFTVQWDKVVLQDKPSFGEFTFQATLHSNGDIVFVYQNVPIIIEEIQDDQHPVKVGLSDAYIIDRTIFFVRRKTIYEYHRVNFKKEDIKNWTVIYLNALPTCMEKKDCHSCVTADIGFDCKWCSELGRCSTGMDRQRQDWLHNECDRQQVSVAEQCQELSHSAAIHRPSASAAASPNTEGMEDGVRSGGSSYLGAAFVIVLIAGVAVWAMYAYSNPHSTSGQILIRYRPSQWSWRRREAGYTAATIHM